MDKSTRPAGGDRAHGVDGIGDGDDEDEEREGIQSRKAELEQKLRDLSQRPDIWLGRLHLRLGDGRREKGDIIKAIWWCEQKCGKRWWGWWTSI